MQKQVNIPMLLNIIFTVRAAPGAAVLMAGVLCLIKLLSRRLRINVILNGIEKDLFEALRGIHIPGRLPGMAVKEMANQAGFQLDYSQNIFYSKITAWQRRFGYCRLYDEAAAPLGMIIDCEPIYFTYDDRQWLIEFWKGQYGMTTGAEMGVYYTQEDGARPETLFYHSAEDRDMLKMCCVVRRNGQILFRRKQRHWWLTGFLVGEFSEPAALTMDLSVRLKNPEMRAAFIKGLEKAGYQAADYRVYRNTVSLCFRAPKQPQPNTRTPASDRLAQEKNRKLCETFRLAAGTDGTIAEQLWKVRKQNPALYEQTLRFCKVKTLYNGKNGSRGVSGDLA